MWPFRKKTVEPASARDLFDAIRTVARNLDALRDDVESLRAQQMKTRGRVYALWGKEVPADEPQKPVAPSDLNDPSLSKAQVRAALVAQGRLKPQ